MDIGVLFIMITDVQELLKKHSYKIIVKLAPNGETLLSIPKRSTAPIIPQWNIVYQITNIGVSINMNDGHEPEDIPCPLYARRSFILADIDRIANVMEFSSSLIDFFDGEDIITREEFFERMLPANIILDEETQKLEESLVLIVDKAKKFVLPFHAEFGIEAQIAGVEHGYALIEGLATIGIGEIQ